MAANRLDNARKNIIWGIANRIVMMILPFINRTMLLYMLGRNYLGLDSLFTSVLQMINIAEIGFSSAVIFSMYKPIAENDADTICALMRYYRKVYRIIGAVVLGVGLIITPFLRYFIKGDVPSDVNLYVLYIIFLVNTALGYWLFAYKKALITAHQKQNILSNANTVANISKIVLQIVLVFVLKSYYAYIIIMPLATIGENISLAIISHKKYPQYACKGNLSKEFRKDIGQKVKGLLIQKVCTTSRNSMDNIVISAFVGLTAVSIYGNYYTIMNSVHMLILCLTTSIAAGVGDSIASETVEKNHNNMLKFDFIYMWIGGWSSICLLCLYQPFIRLWTGEQNLLDFYIVFAICFYHYTLCMGDIKYVYTTGAGLWWEGRYRSILEAITNIVLNIVLGMLLGTFGIVLATIISVIGINFLYGATIMYKYYFKNGLLKKYYLSHLYYLVVTCVAGAATYFLCTAFDFGGLWDIMLRGLICIVVPNCIYIMIYHKNQQFSAATDMMLRTLKIDKLLKRKSQ